nr:glucan endo-1,3-beta-glucosidase 12-like [Tanacetum cinerariifolium]
MDSVSAKLNTMPATVTSSALALFWLPLPLVPGPSSFRSLNRYKARLIENGSTQLEGINVDGTFSLVVKPVYMHQPLGFQDSAHLDYVCLLQRSVYGLKEALQAWFQRSAAYITRVGFAHSRYYSSLFTYRQGTDTAYLLFYVDDIVLTASSENLLQRRQSVLSRSSAKAEYRGVANAVVETCWLRNLLIELYTPLSSATLVDCDNVSAVYLYSNPVQHQFTKHIEIDIHFVRDLVVVGQMTSSSINLSALGLGSAIYCNNAIHWINHGDNGKLHYKLNFVNTAVILTKIRLPVTVKRKRSCKLFESRGSLLILGMDNTCSLDQLNVYKMGNGDSEWSLKYSVNQRRISLGGVWCIALGEREEDSFMVIELNGKSLHKKLVSFKWSIAERVLCDSSKKPEAYLIQSVTSKSTSRMKKELKLDCIKSHQLMAIAVGNEVFVDPANTNYLVPAMKNIYSSLMKNKINNIKVSSPIALSALATSYPTSSGSFKPELIEPVLKPMFSFLQQTDSYLMVNVYPFFAYEDNTDTISLDYALLRDNKGVKDEKTGIVYKSLFDAQVDSVYAALDAVGFNKVKIVVSETGWPSKGDSDETGAAETNAAQYNGNLVRRVLTGGGSPMRPDEPLTVYLFALFNENQKTGPTSEKNYGLFYPNEEKVYNVPLSLEALKNTPSEVAVVPVSAPSAAPVGATHVEVSKVGQTWCVANGNVGNEKLQKALDYACGEGGADCRPIQNGDTCYDPNTVEAHASYAFNSYYQKSARVSGSCDFGGAAYVVTQPPRYGSCKFPTGY